MFARHNITRREQMGGQDGKKRGGQCRREHVGNSAGVALTAETFGPEEGSGENCCMLRTFICDPDEKIFNGYHLVAV